jgi:lipopolysaccharide biosynthesis protein
LVFSDENPERQITIRKEEPQITVIKTTSGFKIESNVDTNKIEGNYMVKREKETLIKIIELRKSQRDIILTLNRISIFPLQTEKQSTEVLQELNKNFIIHSELSA